jgi:hypothetical protein
VTVVNAALCLLCFVSTGVRVEIVGDAGKNYWIDDASFQADWKIAGKREGKDFSLSAEGLVGVRFPGKGVSENVRTSRVLLATGELVRGELLGTENEQLKMRSASLGEYRIPLTAVRALALDPEVPMEKLQGWLADAGNSPSDRLILKNGDVAPAALLAVEGDKMRIQKDDKESTVARELVAAVLTDPTLVDYPAPKEFFAQLLTADGSRFHLKSLQTVGEKFKATPFFGGGLTVEPGECVELSFRNGRVVYLSDLKPQQETAEPYADDRRAARRDQSVLGSPLRLHGRIFAKGIGVKSRSELIYSIGGYEKFEAKVGLDDAADPKGSVRFRVLVDGKQAFDSGEVVADDQPKSVSVPVRGASTLTLIVDFEKRGDVEDFADWCDARLVR